MALPAVDDALSSFGCKRLLKVSEILKPVKELLWPRLRL